MAAIKGNPIDPNRTLLGLFAVNLGKQGVSNGDGTSFVGLSISCDGVAWSPLAMVAPTQVSVG